MKLAQRGVEAGHETRGQGRLLPSTSVDQFAATLAQWFGCSATELPGIMPNIGNFASLDLGFLSA